MDLVATKDGKQIWFLELSRPFRLDSPFAGEEYVCTLFVNDTDITREEQADISAQLVRTGCRNVHCAGHLCSTWDDSVDWAYLESVKFEPNDETFVMTSWDESGSIEDIVLPD